ncbi:3-isopropylmalate dehydratase small subunit [Bradyrhizobium tropiciagri]|uniref:3-isopropylmalate dehydratase small subunit n=1 Tax=Bradyrhizobium tropiciagri TaxID=312253 RepID=UPI001BA7974A|nr:3-isopropylmalate dehydratase small subunit [Bradyrhizobium tropiciagri]MBR0896753.1 3-isopropylmalate dehydratase small subunit [Bradyrhizobium tropiciagri]
MEQFGIVEGIAAPMPAANVDTDVIMPKQFLKGIDRSGLGDGTFHGLRFGPNGEERAEFVLNRPEWRTASFLVVGPNFGCGSSREHAVWGLRQLGIRALLGTSFAGIFFDNCARNGLLALTLDHDAVRSLTDLASDPATAKLTVDLPRQSITAVNGKRFAFDIEPARKEALELGLDGVATTLRFRDDILAFERDYLEQSPWLM